MEKKDWGGFSLESGENWRMFVDLRVCAEVGRKGRVGG